MKQIFTLLVWMLLCMDNANAQAPQKINYQAVARTATGDILMNNTVSLRFTIRDLTATGALVYRETHSNVLTNQLGLFSVSIGGGVPVSGNFSAVSWGSGDKYLQVELDTANGNLFTDMGSSQLLSVPYSLFSGNGLPAVGANAGDMLYWNGTAWTFVPVGIPGQVLTLGVGSVPQWQTPPAVLQTPTLLIDPATLVTTTTAMLNGKMNANNLSSTAVFEYGLTTSYGNQIVTSPGTVTGTVLTSLNALITGLVPGTTYHYRLKGTNAVGVSYSSDTTFTTTPAYSLNIVKLGTGSGTVVSSPAGIVCGGDCSELYAPGTMVTLTAIPASGSVFSGWSGGGCSGTGTCVTTMNAAVNISAIFNPN